MGDGYRRTILLTGARLLCGWAFIAVGVLDLVTGFQTGSYLLFHLVLLAGGLLLLQKPLRPRAYAAIAVLALLSTFVAAWPRNEQACCLRGVEVRHGYPLTVLGWSHGRSAVVAPAHVVADLAFWFLVWLTVSFVISKAGGGRSATDNSVPPSTGAPVARDESVGGLP